MDNREISPQPKSPLHENVALRLAAQEAILRDLLNAIEYEAWLMDASLEDAHEIAVSICRIVQASVFSQSGTLAFSSNQDNYRIFHAARIDESDLYEVYADDLERHRKRQRKDLAVTDSDADKFAVIKRRRVYISSLAALQAQVSVILDLLGEQDTPAR